MTNCEGGENRGDKEIRKQKVRLLKILCASFEAGVPAVRCNDRIMLKHKKREHNFRKEVVAALQESTLVLEREGRFVATSKGLDWLKDAVGLGAVDTETNSTTTGKTTAVNGTTKPNSKVPVINCAESPLSRLYNRRKPDGSSYISQYEFEAGERLRRDFERGQLQPRITANYTHVASTSRKTGRAAATNDLSDMAMDARNRVNVAIAALGPELSGVVLDICCFLKRFEVVERERQWPPRSAKLMLRTALSGLARHYGLQPVEKAHGTRIHAWGSEGFRPQIRA